MECQSILRDLGLGRWRRLTARQWNGCGFARQRWPTWRSAVSGFCLERSWSCQNFARQFFLPSVCIIACGGSDVSGSGAAVVHNTRSKTDIDAGCGYGGSDPPANATHILPRANIPFFGKRLDDKIEDHNPCQNAEGDHAQPQDNWRNSGDHSLADVD